MMKEDTNLVAADDAAQSQTIELAQTTGPASSAALLLNPQALAQIQSFAADMATGKSTIPDHLKGNTSDCMAVTMQALQWGMIPHLVAQKTHIVNGTLGYEAQLVNAVVQSSNSIKGRFHYEYQGEGHSLACRVGAVITGETEIEWGEWLVSSSVTTKNSPLWKTNPAQQLGYLQVKNWARKYCPGAILGVYTPDELREIPAQEIEITGESEVVTDLNEKLNKEKIKTIKAEIGKADSLEDIKKIGDMIANEPKEVREAVRDEYTEKGRILQGYAKQKAADDEQAMQAAIDAGAPSYAEVMDMIHKAKESVDVEAALGMIGHLPADQQAEIQVAAGNALEAFGGE